MTPNEETLPMPISSTGRASQLGKPLEIPLLYNMYKNLFYAVSRMQLLYAGQSESQIS